MTSAPLPTEFDWVRARAACSLFAVFKELHLGAESDVQAMALSIAGHVKFTVTPLMRGRFSVVREDGPFPESVTFALMDDGSITVHNDEKAVVATATVTLNDRGECKLKAETAELEQWQFRRRALEKLFFRPRSS